MTLPHCLISMAGRSSNASLRGLFHKHFTKHFWIGVILLVGSCCGQILDTHSAVLYRRFQFYQSDDFQFSVIYKTKTAAQCIVKCHLSYCFAVEYHVDSGDCQISETVIAMPNKYNPSVISMIPKVLPTPRVTHILILGGNRNSRGIFDYIPETKYLSKKDLKLPGSFSAFHHVKYTREDSVYIIIEESIGTPLALLKANPLSIENATLANSFTPESRPRCGGLSADGRFYYSLTQGNLHIYDIYNNYNHSYIANADVPIRVFACHFVNNRVFIFGGKPTYGKVYEIDLTSGLTIYSGNLPRNYADHEAVWFQNGVVLCGNTFKFTFTRKGCDKFLIGNKTWVNFPDLNYGRSRIGLVEWDGKLLTFGGSGDNTPIVEVSDGVSWKVFDNNTIFDGFEYFEAVNVGKF